jgi:hypothetical protein
MPLISAPHGQPAPQHALGAVVHVPDAMSVADEPTCAQQSPAGQSWSMKQAIEASRPLRTHRPWSHPHVACCSSGQLEAQPRAHTGRSTVHAICPAPHAPQPHQYGWHLHAPSAARTSEPPTSIASAASPVVASGPAIASLLGIASSPVSASPPRVASPPPPAPSSPPSESLDRSSVVPSWAAPTWLVGFSLVASDPRLDRSRAATAAGEQRGRDPEGPVHISPHFNFSGSRAC